MYRSISGGPGQGSELDDRLAIESTILVAFVGLTLARTSHFCG